MSSYIFIYIYINTGTFSGMIMRCYKNKNLPLPLQINLGRQKCEAFGSYICFCERKTTESMKLNKTIRGKIDEVQENTGIHNIILYHMSFWLLVFFEYMSSFSLKLY